MLVAAHAPAQQLRLGRDHRPHVAAAVERDGAEDVEPRALREQDRRRPPRARGRSSVAQPSTPELVVVALAVDIGSGLDQALDDIEVAALRRPVQRRGIIEPVAPVHVEAAREQQLDAIEVPAVGGKVQQRPVPSPPVMASLPGCSASSRPSTPRCPRPSRR